MKNFVIPRTMEQGHWSFNADPIEHYPQSRTERAASVVLATAIAIALAAAIVHWWSA